MKVTDLTHLICSDMQVFPGTEQPILERANTLEKDGFRLGDMGEHIWIEPPVHMAYGTNVHIGDHFYANFNLVIREINKRDKEYYYKNRRVE